MTGRPPSSTLFPYTTLFRSVRHGHEAYLVGGCVRDLLLGRKPKDFDVATSARPEEVRELFRNSRIIGRRFRLVHVLFHGDRKSTRLNSSHRCISYAVFCLKK